MARLGSPFESPAMAEAYTAASYARLQMGLSYDQDSGDLTCAYEPYSAGAGMTASPGEVLSNESIMSAMLDGSSNYTEIARIINVAFMLGALSQHVSDDESAEPKYNEYDEGFAAGVDAVEAALAAEFGSDSGFMTERLGDILARIRVTDYTTEEVHGD